MFKKRVIACLFVGGLAIATAAVAQGTGSSITRLPPVQVSGERVSENTLIGEYAQPEWTTHRRFPTTRVYLQQPPGAVGVGQWWRADYPSEGRPRHRFRTEVEIGLPHRMQLDLYEDTIYTREGTFYHNDFAVELRYALAEWGKIPLNPTLYGEYKFANSAVGPDAFELKLLLGDSIGEDWHYAFNLVWEQQIGDEREQEFELNQALAYSVLDRRFSIGEEMKVNHATEKGGRGDEELAVSVGPSFQYRIGDRTHLDFVGLIGANDEAADLETYLVLAVDLGALPTDGSGPRAPVSAAQ